ncbi:hypothetical protein BT96DRAFT_1002363 [Gymnopus androsaceus JB14]|uniref:Uncharacterized protein n=1 Tax=Gymnopus androsaceus JB14 TaxID=1447944 RepID=A0A6A4GY13_9AGAR|nr:hypothetical protein BT96DRAFT_1002363 [Gymnopus androsaceus JB14]
MASELAAHAKDIEDKLLSTEEALDAQDAVFSKKGKDTSSTHQLVADALAHLHKALSKKVMLEKASCSNYFVEVYSRGPPSNSIFRELKDKKKLGTLLGNYHSMSLSGAQAIAEEVAAASHSNAIIVDDKGEKSKKHTHEASAPKGLQDIDLSQNFALLVLALASMEVNNEVEAGTASDSQSAETNHSHSSPTADVEDGSPSEASDEGPSFHTGTGFIIDFAQEPDYQYFFGVPVEPDNHCNNSSIPPNEGVFIMDPLKTNPVYLHPSLFTALPSGEVPPPYASTSGDTSSPGTCMLIIDMGNPFEERGWHQRMIVTPHHGVLHPLLTPGHSPHLFQFPCSPKVLCGSGQVGCLKCQPNPDPALNPDLVFLNLGGSGYIAGSRVYRAGPDLTQHSHPTRKPGIPEPHTIPNFPFIFPLGNWMPPEVAKIRCLRVKCRQMFLEHLAPILHGGVWDGALFQTQCSFQDAEDCLCLVLNPISDHGFSWENPLAMELLESIALKSVTKLSGLPIPALRAMMNFHCVEYLHNIELACLYAQCAEASHSICDQALANLTTKLSIEAECIDPPISESTSQVSGNIEMSSLDPPEPPLA